MICIISIIVLLSQRGGWLWQRAWEDAGASWDKDKDSLYTEQLILKTLKLVVGLSFKISIDSQSFQRGFSLVSLHNNECPWSPWDYIAQTSKFFCILQTPICTWDIRQFAIWGYLFGGQRQENMCSFHQLETTYWKMSRESALETNTLQRVLLSDW